MNNRIEYEKRREKLLKNVKKHEIIMKYNEISKDELFNKIYNGFNIRLLENKINLNNNINNNNIYNNINNIENNNNINKNKEEEKEKERIRNEMNLLISYNKTNLSKSNKKNKNNNIKNNYTNYNFLKEKQIKKRNSMQKFNYNNKILNTMIKKSSSSSLFNKINNENSITNNSNNNNNNINNNNNNKLNYYLYLQNDISNRLYNYGKYIKNKINLEKNKFNKKLKKNFSSSFMLKTSNKILQKNKSFIIQRNNNKNNKNNFSNEYTFSPKINKNSIRIVKNSRNKNNNFYLYKNNSFNNNKNSNNNNKINEFYETVLINNKIREKLNPIKNEEIEKNIPERIKDLYVNGTLKYTNKINNNNNNNNEKIINNNNNNNNKISDEIIEKFNDYYKKQKIWKENIINNNENLRKKNEENIFKEFTFSPKICNSNNFDFNIPKDYNISNINYIINRRENLYKNEDYESKKIFNNFGSLKYEFFSDYNNNIIKS